MYKIKKSFLGPNQVVLALFKFVPRLLQRLFQTLNTNSKIKAPRSHLIMTNRNRRVNTLAQVLGEYLSLTYAIPKVHWSFPPVPDRRSPLVHCLSFFQTLIFKLPIRFCTISTSGDWSILQHVDSPRVYILNMTLTTLKHASKPQTPISQGKCTIFYG